MSTYKLIYFNRRGRAELARFIFAQAGVKYEDTRLTGEEWQKFKASTEFGGLPKLEVDGKQLSGSQQIGRFLAERFGLAGKDEVENAYIAGINDFIGDLFTEMYKVFFAKDEAQKAEIKKALAETHFPKFLGALDKLAEKSGAEEGWLVGKLTWIDFNMYTALVYTPEEVASNYKTLSKLKASVEALPNIAAWLKERPQTES